MPKSAKKIMVVCIDRDNDLGRKANVQGPVVGRKQNLNAAARLAIADPGESDANSIFAAVKKFDEVSGLYENVEVATLTGHSKRDFESDRIINEQLDAVLGKFPAEAFVLVSDGAEDDQVIPILQSRAPIMSKETVIVKQAREVESAFYTIKEALKDPFVALMVFGIPGVILLLISALPTIGLQLAGGAIGAFFILYGFGIYDRIVAVVRHMSGLITLQRMSFPFYIATILVLAFGPLSAYNTYLLSGFGGETIVIVAELLGQIVAFTAIAGIIFLSGKTIDAVHLRKAFRIKKYFLSGVLMLLTWFIIDAGKNVVVGTADLTIFLASLIVSFLVGMAAFRASNVFDVRNKITKLLIDLPVYSRSGMHVGKVQGIQRNKNVILFMDSKSKELREVKKQNFALREGRILLNA